MLKNIALGVVVVLATVLGGYFGLSMEGRLEKRTAKPGAELLEVVKIEPISVPIIEKGTITGYVVARTSFAASVEDAKSTKALLTTYVSEAVFKRIFTDDRFSFSALKRSPPDAIAPQVVADANERVGRPAIKQLVIENLQFVARDEVRCGEKP